MKKEEYVKETEFKIDEKPIYSSWESKGKKIDGMAKYSPKEYQAIVRGFNIREKEMFLKKDELRWYLDRKSQIKMHKYGIFIIIGFASVMFFMTYVVITSSGI